MLANFIFLLFLTCDRDRLMLLEIVSRDKLISFEIALHVIETPVALLPCSTYCIIVISQIRIRKNYKRLLFSIDRFYVCNTVQGKLVLEKERQGQGKMHYSVLWMVKPFYVTSIFGQAKTGHH